MDLSEYLAENERRTANLFADYDPYRGIGSPIERFPMEWEDGAIIYLPMEMKTDEDSKYVIEAILEEGSYRGYFEKNLDCSWEMAVKAFTEIRIKYDFEYWAAECATIKHKDTAEYVPFIFNRPQRDYVGVLERQRIAGLPVRTIVLKHRQWGCTTLSYTYIAWLQIEKYENRDAWFIGIDKSGGEDVINRYSVIVKNYPFRELNLRNFGSGHTSKILKERNSVLNIGTVEKPNAPSGRTPQMAHLFEVGKWPSNPTVNAENVVQNVESMVHDNPGTVCIIESTAKADTGTYFKSLCEAAQRGETSYEFVFVGWLTDTTCVRELEVSPEMFVKSWTKYDKFLWSEGATFEQIAWYKHQLTKPGYVVKGHYGLMEEYPTTPEEAFQTGARRVIPPGYVQALRETCKEPIARGYLISDGDEGRDIFKNIEWVDDPYGHISIWRFPNDDYGGLLKKNVEYANRTLAALDLGGEWEGADYSVCTVLDRVPMLFDAKPEVVAEWHGHEEADLFAIQSARLAYWYHKAEYIPEANKFESNPHKDELAPDASYTVLDTVAKYYPRVYHRQAFDTAANKPTQRLGFHMNVTSKSLCRDSFLKLVRQREDNEDYDPTKGYVERSMAACDEMDQYLYQQDGKKVVMAAAAKRNDDRVITRFILAFRHLDKAPPRPIVRESQQNRRPMSMARF